MSENMKEIRGVPEALNSSNWCDLWPLDVRKQYEDICVFAAQMHGYGVDLSMRHAFLRIVWSACDRLANRLDRGLKTQQGNVQLELKALLKEVMHFHVSYGDTAYDLQLKVEKLIREHIKSPLISVTSEKKPETVPFDLRQAALDYREGAKENRRDATMAMLASVMADWILEKDDPR